MKSPPPCIGCGYCCVTVICRIGSMLYGHYKSPCPALVKVGDVYRCSLYSRDPDRYGAGLEIGEGCCFPDNPRRCAADSLGRAPR